MNEGARTITFTVPFGSNLGYNNVAVTFEGASQADAQKPTTNFKVETNTTKGVAGTITVQPEDDVKDITYTVTARKKRSYLHQDWRLRGRL